MFTREGQAMKRSVLCILVLTLVFAASATLAPAQTPPVFKLGFEALADRIPDVVGVPVENEYFNLPNGNSEQHTTKGLMVWRKADNWTAYTNGYMTWVNGPNGVQSRLNTDRFDWEKDEPVAAAPTEVPLQLPPAAPAPTAQPTEAPKAPPAPTPPPAPAPMVFSNPNIYHAEPRVRDVRLPDGLPGQRRS